MKKFYLFLIINIICITGYSQISLVQFSTGFSSPLCIANAGDDRLFVVEQAGRIYIVDTNGVKNPVPFLNIVSRIACCGERGLLGLAFPPDFATSGYFYVDYTATGHGDTHISRFSVSATNPDSAVANSEQILLNIRQPYSNHNGGNVMFGPDGYLYIDMGDGGSGGDPENRAQNVDSLLGKILRIDVSTANYTSPPDNPFVGVAGRDEIWNWGMRNPWRASFDSWTGDMWIGDVGQNAYEEVDMQPAGMPGGNYGWRCYEGNHAYNTSGCGPIGNYRGPVYEYFHSGAAAIVGGYVYRGAEYADIFGKYFFTDEYTGSYDFNTLTPNGAGGYTVASLGSFGRTSVVTFGEDRWRELYCADYIDGNIYKFQSTACQPVAFVSDKDTVYVCDTINPYVLRTPAGNGFHYQWFQDGNAVGTDNDSLLITQPGTYVVSTINRSSCFVFSTPVQVIYSGRPAVSMSGLDTMYCSFDPAVTLTGTPVGGIFSGNGLSGTGNSTFTPIAAGIGYETIFYHYTNPVTGCANTDSSITHVDICGSVKEQSNIYFLEVYPNPNHGEFTFSFYLAKSEMLNAEITDVMGHVVYKEDIQTPSGLHSIPMKLNQFAAGIYNLRISESDRSVVKRFVIE